MKKLLLLLLLLASVAHAQIVNIPNANFKMKLLAASPANQTACKNGVYVKIDTNNDSNIQLSEAMAIDSLNVTSSMIADMTGIASFTNLKKLDCTSNQIAALDVSALTGLRTLDCANNAIATLNVTGLADLQRLYFYSNQVSTIIGISSLTGLKFFYGGDNDMLSLDLSSSPNLEELFCNSNNLSLLNVSGLSHLADLACSGNELTALNVSGLGSLKNLTCFENNLGSLNLTGLSNLETLICYDNGLTAMAVGSLPKLKNLNIEQNQLTGNLDLTDCPLLESVRVAGNQITGLDVSGLQHLVTINASDIFLGNGLLQTINASGCTSLYVIYADSNMLTEVNVTGCIGLYAVYASHNQLTAFDVSDSPNLEAVYLGDNQLERVYMKNGGQEYVDFAANPNLAFVCADESEIAGIQNAFNSQQLTAAVVNSYCSFAPGGDYNTLTGTVSFDENGNGCGGNDPGFSNVRIKVQTDFGNSIVFSEPNGVYNFYTPFDPAIIATVQLENPAYFNIMPPSAVVNFSGTNTTLNQSFCISPNGVYHDMEVLVVPIDQPRPGFDAHYKIIFKNKGNQLATGTVNFTFNDAIFDLVGSSPNASNQSSGLLQYDYSGIFPFETRTVLVTLNLNGPMEIPAVNLGDVVDIGAVVTAPDVTDALPEDNTALLHQTVVGSFDPNDKHCLEGTTVNPSQIGQYLHYVINFENTGSAAAENIVVKDVIDQTKFDIESLQLVSASHENTTRIAGNKVEFIFEGIHLAPEGKGHVVFKIKTKSDLAVNSSVSNKADIFFDYNFPVITEPAVTTFTLLGTEKFTADASIRIFPNPVRDIVKVKADGNIQSVTVYDAQGRLLQTQISDAAETAVNFQGYSAGIYYLKVGTASGQVTQSIVKQ
ncbi:leucine-rich repeat domain-containing protein [Flavobacterium sp.]|uniref:DUF7619 domain-containing protein n=1 Tax=Flavobacterium sp. TaxID=239 RepID=UPI0039E31C41